MLATFLLPDEVVAQCSQYGENHRCTYPGALTSGDPGVCQNKSLTDA